MPRVSTNVTRAECSAINKIVMEKLDNLSAQINEIAISLAKLPEQMAVKFDARYAPKETESDLRELRNRIEARNYDWLKQTIITLISIILAIGVYSRIK